MNLSDYGYVFKLSAPDAETFRAAVQDCKRVCEYLRDNSDIAYAGWDGTGEAVFNDDEISFNGKHSEAEDTFAIRFSSTASREVVTRNRPYDLCVLCCLIVFKDYFGDHFSFSVSGHHGGIRQIRARDVVNRVLSKQSPD